MPRVKLNTPSTDSLNTAKKRIIANNKKKYQGQEASAPIVREEVAPVYQHMADALNAIIASIGEINAQLMLTAGVNAPWASKAIDRYISATSASKKQIADLNAYIEANVSMVSNFSEAQLTRLTELSEELTNTFIDIIESVNKLSPKRQSAIKKVFSVFVGDLQKLNQLIDGTFGYKMKMVDPTKSTPKPLPSLDKGVLPHPEQEPPDETPVKATKARKPRAKKDAPPAPKRTSRTPTKKSGATSGTEGDTEEGLEGDGWDRGAYIRRRLLPPMLFPSAPSAQDGGVFLPTRDYMPTRFL